MFGMGMSEILIICAVALLVFGPQQLPEMAKKIAKGLKEVRRASDDLKRSINFDDDDDRPRWKPPVPRPPLIEPPTAVSAHLHGDDAELSAVIPGSALANGLATTPGAHAEDVPSVQVAAGVAIDSLGTDDDPPEALSTSPAPPPATTKDG